MMTERDSSVGRSPRDAGDSKTGDGSASPSKRSINGDTPLRQGTSQVQPRGRWIKRTEIIKYFKRTTTSEQYYDDGTMEFSHPPEVREVETEPSSQSVSIFECSDEAYAAGRSRWKAGANIEEVNTEGIATDEGKTEPTIQEPSEGGDSLIGSDFGELNSKGRKSSRVRSIVSEDEDEVKTTKANQSKTVRPSAKDNVFSAGAYVLARYNDNMYYPAQILSKDDQIRHWTVRFSDSKEEESLHETVLLKPSVWLVEGRSVMIKSGEGKGGEYLEAKIISVVKQEGKAPRYSVKVHESGETKTVPLLDVAITDDEVLNGKFDTSLKSLGDEAGSTSNGTRTDGGAFSEGDVVFGLWTDQRFYPGKIAGFNKDNKFSVDFLDQQHAVLPADDLILAEDIVRPGHSVQVQMPNSNFEKALVKAVKGSGDGMQATVEYPDERKDTCLITEMCFLSKDVRKVLSAKATNNNVTVKMEQEKGSPQRSSARVKSENVKEEPSFKSPPKMKEPKAKKPKTESGSRIKEIVLNSDDEDDDDGLQSQSSDKTQFRIGQTVFNRKEEVFGLWEDKRWYAAWINGVRQSKFRVEWCENEQINFLGTDEIIRASDILQKGTRVNVIVENKDFYDEVTLESFMEDGNHLVKNKKNTIYPKKFEEMMIQAEEVKKWRKKKDAEKKGEKIEGESTSKSRKRSSPSPERISKKRQRSPSPEKEKPSKGGRRSAAAPKPRASKSSHVLSPTPEESPERDPGPPLANCSFIITSGQEKEKTFDRDYIAKKVVELGGAVLNTFEELTQSAGKRYLIAPGPCRTAKFLQCLAANIPCISHTWILAVAEAQKMVDCDKYRLKTGKSTTLSEMMDWAPRKTLLDNLRVGLYGGNSFRTTWVPALKAGKAEPTVLEPHDTKSNMKRFDCVIVEDHAPAALVEHCHLDACPLVTVEWIIQTLIHGTKQSFEQWPYTPPDANGNSVSGVEDSMMRTPSRQ